MPAVINHGNGNRKSVQFRIIVGGFEYGIYIKLV
jgi:hypothetical protein